jgi:hypothetical protein
MGLIKSTHHSQRQRFKGVALLMSLSVVLLLSVALMKTFEKRSVEVANLGHNLDRFQAENLSRSGLKLILFAIKQAGLVTFNTYLDQIKQMGFPVGDGTVTIQEVTPIDYRFDLNREIRRYEDPRIQVFKNIVNISKEGSNDFNYLSGESTHEALSSIIDWTDPNEVGDTVFHFDAEQYPQAEPGYRVKNTKFDRLSELNLLPAFRSMGFTSDYLEANFKVVTGSKSDISEYIDLNLTRLPDIEKFLQRYDNMPKYANLYDNREEILGLIKKTREEAGSNSLSGFKESAIPFPVDELRVKWTDEIVARGITLSTEEKNLFKPSTEHLFISYQINVGTVTLNIRSMIRVSYITINNKESLDIQELKIVWFRIS